MIAKLEIILHKNRNSDISIEGYFLTFTMDHTQIQPIQGNPFFTSYHIISCFETVALEQAVIYFNDAPIIKIQNIAQFS